MSEKNKSRKIISTYKNKKEYKDFKNKNSSDSENSVEMVFKKENFYFVFGGLLVMVLGFILMSGGNANPSPDVFDADSLYSLRRVFVAPLVILIGLGLNIYAIFKK